MVIAVTGTIAFLAYRILERGGDESLPRRILYVFAPIADPRREGWKPSLLVATLIFIGTMVFIAVFLLVDRGG